MFKGGKLFYSIAIIFLLSNYAMALTLSEAIKLKWQRSNILKEQNNLYQISLADQWRRYLPGEPQLQVANNDDGLANTYGLSIGYPLPFKSLALSDVDKANTQLQAAELRARKYDLAVLITQAYLDCSTSLALYNLQIDYVKDLETLNSSLKSLYSQGLSNLSDTIGAELQLNQANSDLRTMQDKLQVSISNFRLLMGNPEVSINYFALPDDLDPDILNELGENTANKNRAEASIGSTKATINTAGWQQWPDLNLSVIHNQYPDLAASPAGKNQTASYQASMTLPIMFFAQENIESRRTISQAKLAQAYAELQLQQASIDELDSGLTYKRSRVRLQELRTKDIPLAETFVSTTFADYKLGKADFSTLMQSRKTLNDLRSQDIQFRGTIISSHLKCLNNKLIAD